MSKLFIANILNIYKGILLMTIPSLTLFSISIPKFRYNTLASNSTYTPLFDTTGYLPYSGLPNLPDLSSFPMTSYIPSFPILPSIDFSKILSVVKSGVKKTYKTVKNNVSSTFSSIGRKIVNTAKKYIGYNEKDGSYLRFTNGRREAWCADFVSYVCKQAGIKGPNTASVEGIRRWGKARGKYSKPAKVGSAVIFKNGISHTGVVESISNGKITCIEGNTSDRVARRTYSINDSRISGFVELA